MARPGVYGGIEMDEPTTIVDEIGTENEAPEVDDVLVEEVSIDGMCGVY
jgi:mycofactocin precursor